MQTAVFQNFLMNWVCIGTKFYFSDNYFICKYDQKFLIVSVTVLYCSWSSTRLAFAIWMIPTRSLFYCYIFFLYSFAVLCLVADVNLTYMCTVYVM